MNERRCCIVPFCRRTRKPWGDGSETRWVCGIHWRHVSKVKKRRMSRALRVWNKVTACGERNMNSKAAFRWNRIWWATFDRACKEAVEAAAGIA